MLRWLEAILFFEKNITIQTFQKLAEIPLKTQRRQSMPPKKLCIITPAHWSHGMGGAEYQVKLLVDKMLLNKNVHLIYLSRRIEKGFRPSQYDLIKISTDNMFQQYGFFFDTFSLLKLLKKIKPDIIYQRVGCSYTGIAAYYAQKTGCRMIWHISSDNGLSVGSKWTWIKPHVLIDDLILKWGIKNARVIVTQSAYQKKAVEQINHHASIYHIRNFHPLPKGNITSVKSDQIVWVSNLKQLKQPEMYIDLAERLEKSGIKTQCIVIGSPPAFSNGYGKNIMNLMKNSSNLNYLGRLPQEKVNEIINQSKLLINTSKWEGFPNTFIQAWMRKTPVVSLYCDPDYVIRDYRCGLVSGTLNKMVEDVICLLNNEQERKIMGENAQKYAFENHSMKNLEKLENIILETV